jgi:hypothetical protein
LKGLEDRPFYYTLGILSNPIRVSFFKFCDLENLAKFSTTLAKLVKFRIGKQRSPKFAQIALLKKQQILFLKNH